MTVAYWLPTMKRCSGFGAEPMPEPTESSGKATGELIAGRLVDYEAIVPIAWCYLHNAVRDHHIETERCVVPRSLLVRLDAALDV